MKKRKLNYQFHNPNSTAATTDCLLKIMIEANTDKVQIALQNAINYANDIENNSVEKHFS